VAVKLLRSRDPDLRRRFVQESEVLARMDHPAIVRVFAHDRDGEDLYTVLELLEGADLREHLVRSGPLPWRQVLELGIQIAEALEAVHRHGLVHRDVKPENIMLTAAGTPMRVKLIDFGVVRITANYRAPTGAPARQPTDMGTALGTPGYLPLEAGLVEPNPSFDVFGLGATLYELLTGKRPEEPQRTLREMHPGCDAPEDLGHVLAAALAREPEDRTQTAAELGRALEAIRATHPEQGAPSSRIDGRYELIGLAGTGGKADAYLAVHRGAGHDVVLKFLRSPDPNDALRFVREAKLLETFNHPALPRFYDFAPEAKPPYIAMACAPGQPAVRLCSSSRLKPTEVAAVGVKLAQVLAVVHARGVLHRDINANNVLIDAAGAVTLLDFGCAELGENFYNVPPGERRYLTPPEARVVIPSGGIGKLAWSAPEVRGDTGWTEKSDVYSMGHLLFRMVTGKVPVKGAEPPTSPLESVVTCPEEIASAIQSTLRVDPEARPTAAQFAKMLIDALESEEEEWARAVAAAKPAGRPPLRLVTAGDRADWTDHPLPDSSGSFAAEALAREVSAASSATPKPAISTLAPPPSHRTASGLLRVGLEALAAATILVLALRDGDGHVVAEPSPAPQAAVVHGAAESSTTRPSSGVTPEAAVVTSSLPAPLDPQLLASSDVPKPMREALADAASELRHCSDLAGGPLIVQFTTAKAGDSFADVAIHSRTSPAVDRCVGDATAGIRFQPLAEPQRFTEEYP
jgi:serine/threonine-protein kinase